MDQPSFGNRNAVLEQPSQGNSSDKTSHLDSASSHVGLGSVVDVEGERTASGTIMIRSDLTVDTLLLPASDQKIGTPTKDYAFPSSQHPSGAYARNLFREGEGMSQHSNIIDLDESKKETLGVSPRGTPLHLKPEDMLNSAPTVAPGPMRITGGFDGIKPMNNDPASFYSPATGSAAPSIRFFPKDNARRSSLTTSFRLHTLQVPQYSEHPSTFPGSAGLLYSVSSHVNQGETSIGHSPMTDTDILLQNNRPLTNSAPPSPAAINVLHPSEFIHTHHPRRGSLTPLNLNTISPMPPPAQVQAYVRRQSQANSALSFEGLSSPGGLGARRKSLTPSTATLATASPTKHNVQGNIGRRNSGWTVDYNGREVPTQRRRGSLRPFTAGDAPSGSGRVRVPPSSGLSVRRSSQPTTQDEAAYTDAVLTSRKSSTLASDEVGNSFPLNYATGNLLREASDPTAYREDFKFGEPTSSTSTLTSTSAFGTAPRSRSPSSSASRASPSDRTSASKFSDGESIEAERQRLAFLNSTYGVGSRTSIAGGGIRLPIDMRRTSMIRREDANGKPILMGNEGYCRGSLGIPGLEDMSPPTPGMIARSPSKGGENWDLTARRGSIPINIPKKQPSQNDFAMTGESLAESSSKPREGLLSSLSKQENSRKPSPLARPLPPLLPLSDPGPRLLPSTLALHRANHLLQSKNLESEPMPHPLPPSLHPPPPVDVSDFDIDFILAGATTPAESYAAAYGTAMSSESTQLPKGAKPGGTTLKLGPGGDDEDTFAKFVGAFDEEYDDRRDGWTFKVAAHPPGVNAFPSAGPDGTIFWECPCAGRYTISSAGDVTSDQTGKTWRIRRRGNEYEVSALPVLQEDMMDDTARLESRLESYILAAKMAHTELGGVKISRPRQVSTSIHRNRTDSSDSRATIVPMPYAGGLETRASDDSNNVTPTSSRTRQDRTGSFLPTRRTSKGNEPTTSASTSLSQITQSILPQSLKKDKKDKSSMADKIKRTWKSGFKTSDDKREHREDKKREKQQSQSWSGSSSSTWSHAGTETSQATRISRASEAREYSNLAGNESPLSTPWIHATGPDGKQTITSPELADDDIALPAGTTYKEGKAWEAVPDDAIAMVIPLCGETPETSVAGIFMSANLRTPGLSDYAYTRALLVYFVPFVSNLLSEEHAIGGTTRQPSFSQRLRRTKSRDKAMPSTSTSPGKPEVKFPVLPFRSFRIVAQVVEPSDLKAKSTVPSESHTPIIAEIPEHKAEQVAGIMKRNRFPTVIAVCHSRAQGVEFVLEGLDRLGLCEGNSAWGPTGYEEWRGSGLSEAGRAIFDVLWTGCVAVLGINAKQI